MSRGVGVFFSKDTSPETNRRRPIPVQQRKVVSYRSNRAYDTTGRHRLRPEVDASTDVPRHHLWRIVRYLPSMIAIGIIVGCVGYNFMLSTTPRIIVSGQDSNQTLLQDNTVYQKKITQLLQGSVLNRTKITIDTVVLGERITKEFPEVTHVRVSIPVIGQKPIVYVEPSEPAYILQTASENYVLDSTGAALATVVSGNLVATPRVIDESGVTVTPGKQAIPQSVVAYMQQIERQLNAKSLRITEFRLPAGSQLLVARIAGTTYSVRFSVRQPVIQQVGTYIAAREEMIARNVSPTQYVDVRVPERVYFQ